jgi:hypothetical protein
LAGITFSLINDCRERSNGILKRKYLDFALINLKKLNSSSMCSKTLTQRRMSDFTSGTLSILYSKLSKDFSFLKSLASSMT